MIKKLLLSATAAMFAMPRAFDACETVVVTGENGKPVRMNKADYNKEVHGELHEDQTSAIPATTAQVQGGDGVLQPNLETQRGNKPGEGGLANDAVNNANTRNNVPTYGVVQDTKKPKHFFVIDAVTGARIERDGIDSVNGYKTNKEGWDAITAIAAPVVSQVSPAAPAPDANPAPANAAPGATPEAGSMQAPETT